MFQGNALKMDFAIDKRQIAREPKRQGFLDDDSRLSGKTQQEGSEKRKVLSVDHDQNVQQALKPTEQGEESNMHSGHPEGKKHNRISPNLNLINDLKKSIVVETLDPCEVTDIVDGGIW